MELRQLRYLVAVAQELSFTNAAVLANIAQPALSSQIRKLEDELGTALVDRTTRRVQMTAAGQRLVERAINILDEIEAARAEIMEATELTAGRLAVGATQTLGPLAISRLLSDFHSLHPGIELAVREELSVMIADRLRRDEIDLGFVSEIPQPARHGLDLERIAVEPLVVAFPRDHRLSDQRTVNFTDLRDERFVLFPEGATIRSTFDQLAAARGMTPSVAVVTTDTDRMREMIALGLGVGLLPLSDATRPGQCHATLTDGDQTLTYSVYLARRRRRRHSPATIAMTSLVKQVLAGDAAANSDKR